MPPRKRQAESTSAAPIAKRRSARQAAAQQQQQPAEPVPKESGAAKVANSRQGKKRQQEEKDDDSDVEEKKEKPPARRVEEKRKKQKVNASTAKQAGKDKDTDKEDAKKRKPAKAKSEKSGGESGAGSGEASGRAVSEDPDPDSLPTRNPEVERHEGEWYWLMKAEPESRFENGIDVRFSIDDLRAREKPEPWDGIRNYGARNNMRAMNAGDKSFFYHSNCKEPGIVGIMEIVKEYSEDKSARRPGTPYYDPSATKDKNKWGLVHVKFVKKFAVPITLKELKEMGQAGKPLESMQMIKQSRLSVSKVGKEEWEYLCGVADRKAEEAGLEHEVD